MKNYRNAFAAVALTFVLSTSAFAAEGVIHTEKTPPPPPPSTQSTVLTGTAATAPEEVTLMEIALSLLQNLIPLL
ncbi:MAG TPA: hypothetical protein VEX70_06590 [Pyrinomonadaceae bacterium]|jgi:hypothetical protein|nr:hypothetical protein [Pyrinomonadaceae bacterium]